MPGMSSTLPRRPDSTPADAGSSRAAGVPLATRAASLAALALATFAAFAGVLRNRWILFDDPDYIFANPHINRGLTADGLHWIMGHPHGGNFHPLTSVLYMLDAQFLGSSPVAHHAVCLLFHVATTLLLAVALHRLTGAWWRSLIVAAVFAVHPLRVESVAWISELKDVLSGFFFALTLWSYARWAERPGALRWGLVALALACGLLSKPMLVTLPGVLVLLDVWPLGRWKGVPAAASRTRPVHAPARNFAGLVFEKWLLVLLVVAFSALTFWVQRSAGAVVGSERLPVGVRLLNAALSAGRYLGLTFWPRDLVPFHMLVEAHALAWGPYAVAGLLAVSAFAVAMLRRWPWIAVGWFWYLGTLVPVIGIVQVGLQGYADRYTYLTVIGFTIALVWTLALAWPRGRAGAVAAVGIVGALVAVFGVATARQVARWRDNHTLFSYTLARDPQNIMAHFCLATELLDAGKPAEAAQHLRAILAVSPANGDTHANLGLALTQLGRPAEAVPEFEAALRIHDRPTARHNFARTLMKLDRVDEAIVQYQAALRLDPDREPTLVELGAALGMRNRLPEAEAALKHAVDASREPTEARRLLAVVLTREGDVEGAVAQYARIVEAHPDDADALNNIAWIRATHADPRHRSGAEAVRFAERAVAAQASAPQAVLFSTLAAAYAEAGRFADAVRAGERAVDLGRREGDAEALARYESQLARYRAGQPFHF